MKPLLAAKCVHTHCDSLSVSTRPSQYVLPICLPNIMSIISVTSFSGKLRCWSSTFTLLRIWLKQYKWMAKRNSCVKASTSAVSSSVPITLTPSSGLFRPTNEAKKERRKILPIVDKNRAEEQWWSTIPSRTKKVSVSYWCTFKLSKTECGIHCTIYAWRRSTKSNKVT